MTYELVNGQLRGPDGALFPYNDTDPRFSAFKEWLEAGGTLAKADEPPPPEVPSQIQNWQARAILIRRGLFRTVDMAVKGAGNEEMLAAWEYAPNVVRKSSFVAAMANVLDLNDEQIDDLFIEGAKIK